jgi:hypothetical protein
VFDAAPKVNPEMAAEEKKWEVMTERKLKGGKNLHVFLSLFRGPLFFAAFF